MMQTTRRLVPVAVTVIVASLLLTTIGIGGAEDFKIIERKKIEREMVWFNGREGDLEHKPFMKDCRIYVTLVDLMRHIKGTILKGPPQDFIEVERGDVLVRMLPGETYAPPAGQAPAEGRGASAEALAAASPSDYFREVFEARERRSALGEGQKGLLQRLAHVRKRMQRIARAERDAAMTDSRAQALQRQAELLKANVHRVSTGDTSVTVEDYLEEGAPEVTIELDPRLPPVANMERLFRRAKKLARRVAEAERRGAEARERLARVEASAERIEEAKSPDEIEALAAEVAELAGERRTTASTQAAAGARQFVSADGWEVLVGRNAEDNDRLTLRWARSDDLWLHVRGVSGSHVVVPVPRGQSTPRDTLVDAATLAAFYSDARGRPRVEVDYTPVKYVRKPRKAPAGAVVLTRHKTLDLRVEPDRLARLLGR